MNRNKILFGSLLAAAIFLTTAGFVSAQMGGDVGIMHMPVSQAVGEAGGGANTTLSIFMRGGSPYALHVDVNSAASDPTKFQALVYYKNVGVDSDFATSACFHRGIGFHQCDITIYPGVSGRQVQYFLGGIATTSMSSYMPGNTLAMASSSPFSITVQNSNLGSATLTGRVVYSQWVSAATAVTATTTIPLMSNPASYTPNAVGAINPNDWVYINTIGAPIVAQVTAISSNSLTVNVLVTLSADTAIHKLISGVWVFSEGFPYYATSSDQATSTGSFTLSNMAAGSYKLAVFKDGFCDCMPPNFYTGSNNNLIYISAGCGGGMNVEDFSVVWTAPGDNMMNAPWDIAFNRTDMSQTRSPILIGLSQNASSTTITTSTVMLKKVVSGAFQTVTTTQIHYYNPSDANTFCVQSGMAGACLGNERKIILYSSTPLSPNSQYVVELSSGVMSENGNALQGNRTSGGHAVMFTTSPDMSGTSQQQYGQGGAYMPPFVTGMMPNMGAFGVQRDTNILVMFSEPMDSSSLTSSNVKLCKVTSQFTISEAEDCTVSVSLSLDNNAKQTLTLNPDSNLDVSSHYRVKVFGSARSSAGITIGPPEQQGIVVFKGDLDTGTTLDSGYPVVLGTNLNKYTNYSNVSVSQMIEVNFSEGMNPSTIDKNSFTVRKTGGTTNVGGTVEYDVFSNKARFTPSEIYQANNGYTLTIATSVQDLAGNALDGDTSTAGIQTYSLAFNTSASSDATSPKVSQTFADNYTVHIEFDEPMVAVSLSDSKWASSTLNISNYVIKYGAAGTNFSSNCSGGTTSTLSNARVSYDAGKMAIDLEDVQNASAASLTVGNDLCVLVRNVIDLSNNVIDASNDTGIVMAIKDHSQTYGMFGGDGMMMGPPSSAGGMMGPMIGMHDPGSMGTMPISAYPMNSMANGTTMYFFDVPTTKVLEDGSLIIFDFKKQGFNVSSVVPDPYSPMRNDWNGPGACRIRLDSTYDSDGVAVDNTLETVTLKLDIDDGSGGACTANATEFYHFDVASIRNSTANTNGYTVGITTKKSSGETLETNTTMPFYINQGGSNVIQVGLLAIASSTAANINVSNSTAKVMLGSPMTGPMEGTITYDGTGRLASTTFSSLPEGEYFLFTKPSIDLVICNNVGCTATTAKAFVGVTMPDPIRVSGNTTTTRTFTINKEDTSSSTAVTVRLKGNFGSSDVDIFGSSPSGFAKKKITAPGNLANFTSYTLYLSSNGNWRVGVGPAAPEGLMFGGPPPMPDWMPPADIMVIASTSASVSQCLEASAISNDCIIQFEISAASSNIIGYVKDSAGNAINDVGVDGFKLTGSGMPSHAQTDTSGMFTLKVALGSGDTPETYGIKVFKPGFPSAPQKTVVVTQNNKNPVGATDNLTDGNTSANVYLEGSVGITTASPLNIYMDKGGYTISGKVYEDTSSDAKAVAYAPVWVNNTQTGEFVPGGTDSSGNYILYVRPGTWKVSAHTSELGDLPPVTVTITDASQTVNLKPSTSKASLLTISGNTGTGVSKLTGVQVWLEGTTASQQRYENRAMSDSDGLYSLKAPSGTYTIHARHTDFGEYAVVSLGAITASTTQNLAPPSASQYTLLYFNFTNTPASSTRAFVDVFDSTNNIHNGTQISSISSATCTETMKIKTTGGVQLSIKASIPGFGEFEPVDTSGYNSTTHKVTIADGTTSKLITFTLPSAANQIIVSGNVTSTSAAVPDAFIWIGSMSGSFHFNTQTDSDGNYTMRVPAGAYRMGVDKSGYSGAPIVDVSLTTTTIQNFVLTSNSNYISGKITSDGTTAVSNAWVWAEKVTSATNMARAGGWAGAQSDSQGNYQISVGTGYWEVRAVAEGYRETRYAQVVDGSTNPTANITLVVNLTYSVVEPKQQSLIPAQGGVFDDLSGSTGMKITIPSNFDDDQNQGKITVRETTSIPATASKKPVGGKAKEITIYDSNNVALRGSTATSSTAASANTIEIEISYTESDVTAAGYTEDQITLGYFDETNNQWVPVDAVVDKDNDIIRANTSHFSVYAPLLPTGTNPPSMTGTPSAAKSGSAIVVQWATSTDDTLVAGYEVYRSTDGNTFTNISGDSYSTGSFVSATLVNTCSIGLCSWTDSNVISGTTYYYKTAAFDGDGNYSTSSAASNSVLYSTSGQTSSTGGGAVVGAGTATQPPPTPTMPETTSGEVTATPAAGGKTELSSASTTVSVQVPAAAVSSDTKVNIAFVPQTTPDVSQAVANKPQGYSLVGTNVFNLTAQSGTTSVSSFDKFLTITFNYTDVQVPQGIKEATIKAYWWNSASSTWEALQSSVNPGANVVTATTNHFSYFALFGSSAVPAVIPPGLAKQINQMTIQELQVEIARITALITQLQQELLAMLGGAGKVMLKVNLKFGDRGEDVKILQIWLAKDKEVYPEGLATGYFGKLTEKAVIRFQEKYANDILVQFKLKAGNGFVGVKTRLKLNALYGSE